MKVSLFRVKFVISHDLSPSVNVSSIKIISPSEFPTARNVKNAMRYYVLSMRHGLPDEGKDPEHRDGIEDDAVHRSTLEKNRWAFGVA